MDSHYFRHLQSRVRRVPLWALIVAFVACTAMATVALRQNNLTMVAKREALYTADKEGKNVEQALQELRAYVHGHMNTNLSTGNSGVYPPIQLKYTYQRLMQAEQARLNQANSAVYTQAQVHCERLYPGSFSGGPRVPCIQQYVADHGEKARTIPDALYKFDFVSAKWSFDVAGIMVALAVLAAVAVVLRIGLVWLFGRFAGRVA